MDTGVERELSTNRPDPLEGSFCAASSCHRQSHPPSSIRKTQKISTMIFHASWKALFLAEKVANMSATCRPDSQMSAHLAKMPLSWQHNFDPDTFLVSEFANIHQFFLYSTRGTYREFLCKIWLKYLFDIRLPWTFLLLSTPKFKKSSQLPELFQHKAASIEQHLLPQHNLRNNIEPAHPYQSS
jgi:hypothetical protein